MEKKKVDLQIEELEDRIGLTELSRPSGGGLAVEVRRLTPGQTRPYKGAIRTTQVEHGGRHVVPALPVLPTVSGYETRETSKVRPSLPLRSGQLSKGVEPGAGIPQVLFPINGPTVFQRNNYDVTAAGQRFLVNFVLTRRSIMKPASPMQPVLGCLLVLVATAATASAQAEVPETFTATAANMDPAGEDLTFSILRWSTEADRQALVGVLMSLAAEQVEDAEASDLIELPTLGYLWLSSSGRGYALKYAHRVVTPEGGEQITFVTDPRVGTYGRIPWTTADSPEARVKAFMVIELRLDSNGDGDGKMSVAADIVFDTEGSTVALDNYDAAPVLLEAVKRQPPPY